MLVGLCPICEPQGQLCLPDAAQTNNCEPLAFFFDKELALDGFQCSLSPNKSVVLREGDIVRRGYVSSAFAFA